MPDTIMTPQLFQQSASDPDASCFSFPSDDFDDATGNSFDDTSDMPLADSGDNRSYAPLGSSEDMPCDDNGTGHLNPEPIYVEFSLLNVDTVKERIELAKSKKDSKMEVKLLTALANSDGKSRLVMQPVNYTAILDEMALDYPHFEQLIAFLRQQMSLNSLRRQSALNLGANIILNGPPGSGKSSFMRQLSLKLGTVFESVGCASASNGCDLTGLSSVWGSARPGKIYNTLMVRQCANPVFFLDELDKATGNEQMSVIGALYGLLEKNDAKQFRDEFIDVPMDASHINWLATCNNIERLDRPIQDRFEVLLVRAPSRNDLEQMIPRIYRRLLREEELDHAFSAEINPALIDSLIVLDGLSIRRINAVLKQALAMAAQRMAGNADAPIALNVTDIDFLDKEQIAAIQRCRELIL